MKKLLSLGLVFIFVLSIIHPSTVFAADLITAIKVKCTSPANGIFPSGTFTKVDETQTFAATIEPSYATNKVLDWKITKSDGITPTTIATLTVDSTDKTKAYVTAKENGIYKITASAKDGSGVKFEYTGTVANLNDVLSGVRPFIDGDEVVGTQLTAMYTYYSTKKLAENGTLIQWYRSRTFDDSSFLPISGATQNKYTVTPNDEGYYIMFKVTVKAESIAGDTTESYKIGPIMTSTQKTTLNNAMQFPGNRNYDQSVSSIQSTNKTRLASAVLFSADMGEKAIDGANGTVMPRESGSYKAMVNNVVKDLSQKSYIDNNIVYTPLSFLTDVLNCTVVDKDTTVDVTYPGKTSVNVATVTKDGVKYVDIKTLMTNASIGKNVWIGFENQCSFTQGRHKANNMVIISDTQNIFNPDNDKDFIDEALNNIYTLQSTPEQTNWFRDAKYGMFIHWDMSSVINSEISWSRTAPRNGTTGAQNIFPPPVDTMYDTLYKQFNPDNFNAEQWAQMAVDAGMKYVVFITKHHGSFSMFDTKYSNYNIMNTPYNKDILREAIDAFRSKGIKIGVYYSPWDWYNPYFISQYQRRYLEYYYGQMEELLNNYGKIDIIWVDGGGLEGQYDLNGQQTTSYDRLRIWDPRTMIRRFRQWQPNVIFNNRFCMWPNTPPGTTQYSGDFLTTEGKMGTFNNQDLWESCMPIDSPNWSYASNQNNKTLKSLMDTFTGVIGGDGNLLLDFGPSASGEIVLEQRQILKTTGDIINGIKESVYGTRGGPYVVPSFGYTTYKDIENNGRKIYLHITKPPAQTVKTLQIAHPKNAQYNDNRTYAYAYLVKNGKKVNLSLNSSGILLTLPNDEVWDTYDTAICITQGSEDDIKTTYKTALTTLINEGDGLIADWTSWGLGSIFNQSVLNALQTALNIAKTANNNQNATTAELIAAYDSLNGALTTYKSTISAEVNITPNKGVVLSETKFTFTSSININNMQIRYTVDDSEPTSTSNLYNGPTQLPVGRYILKAAVFVQGKKAGPTKYLNINIASGLSNNLSIGSTATASSEASSQYAASKAVDGNIETRWEAGNNANGSFEIKFGKSTTFNTIVIDEYIDATDAGNTRIPQFNVQYSSSNGVIPCYLGGGTGENIYTEKVGDSRYITTIVFPDVTTYNQNTVTINYTNSPRPPSFREVGVYNYSFKEGSGLGLNLALGKVAAASSIYNNDLNGAPGKLCDGNMLTRWSADVSDTLPWVSLDLGEITTFDYMQIYDYVTTNQTTGRITGFDIEYSTDNSTWKKCASQNDIVNKAFPYDNGNYTNNTEKKIISFPAVTGRYVRLKVLQMSNTPSIWEWRIHNSNSNNTTTLKYDYAEKFEGTVGTYFPADMSNETTYGSPIGNSGIPKPRWARQALLSVDANHNVTYQNANSIEGINDTYSQIKFKASGNTGDAAGKYVYPLTYAHPAPQSTKTIISFDFMFLAPPPSGNSRTIRIDFTGTAPNLGGNMPYDLNIWSGTNGSATAWFYYGANAPANGTGINAITNSKGSLTPGEWYNVYLEVDPNENMPTTSSANFYLTKISDGTKVIEKLNAPYQPRVVANGVNNANLVPADAKNISYVFFGGKQDANDYMYLNIDNFTLTYNRLAITRADLLDDGGNSKFALRAINTTNSYASLNGIFVPYKQNVAMQSSSFTTQIKVAANNTQTVTQLDGTGLLLINPEIKQTGVGEYSFDFMAANNTGSKKSFVAILVNYKDGKLLSLKTKTCDIPNVAPLNAYSLRFENMQAGVEPKLMLWDSFDTLRPMNININNITVPKT